MCSLQEAWNDFSLTKSANGNNLQNNNVENDRMKQVREQQIEMDMQRNQNNMNNERQNMDREITTQQFDRINEPDYYTQSNDRRQFSQHTTDIFRPHYEPNLMSKPPTGNSQGNMIRGVHSKFSRTKRIQDNMNINNNSINLTSNIQTPDPLPNTLNEIPNYIQDLGPVDGKPYREGPSNNNEPMAHNTDNVSDAFVSINNNYFDNNINHNNHNNTTPIPNSKPELINNTSNNSLNNTSNNSLHQIEQNDNMEQNKQNDNMEQIKMLKTQIQTLNNKIVMLENKMQNVENNRPHDIILIIVIALFVLFIIDNIFKLNIKF
jgi:hypothetical protein